MIEATTPKGRWGGRWPVAIVAALALGGCGTGTRPEPPCCYEGPVQLAHVDDLRFEPGPLAFGDAFPGYRPQTGGLYDSLPFTDVRLSRIWYNHLRSVLVGYDANANNVIEAPELTVAYLVEAARGLGRDVDRVGAGSPSGAIVLSNAELGGLLRYVENNRERMSATARDLFLEFEMFGRDWRTRGHDGGNRDSSVIMPTP